MLINADRPRSSASDLIDRPGVTRGRFGGRLNPTVHFGVVFHLVLFSTNPLDVICDSGNLLNRHYYR